MNQSNELKTETSSLITFKPNESMTYIPKVMADNIIKNAEEKGFRVDVFHKEESTGNFEVVRIELTPKCNNDYMNILLDQLENKILYGSKNGN